MTNSVREATDDEINPLVEISKGWLRGHADDIGISYESLMAAAKGWLVNWQDDQWGGAGEFHTLSWDTPEVCYSHSKEFWQHYEIVTNEAVDERKKENFFSCSC